LNFDVSTDTQTEMRTAAYHEGFFLIFQFVSYCYLLYCLDTGTRLTTVFFGNCVLGYKGS